MTECSILTVLAADQTNDLESADFHTQRQTHIVQSSIISTDGNIYTCLKTTIKDELQAAHIRQCASFQICGGADLKH